MTEGKERQYWVHIVPPEQRGRKGTTGFTVALLPGRYRRTPLRVKPMAFVSERSFATQTEAQQEADWLFGRLDWKLTKSTSQLRASVRLSAKIPD